jgi:proteasome assembly chaperone (PAC2) family protein
MEHVRRLAEPTLRNPALLFAFTGWNDAGDAASASVRALVERWDATAIAEIDPEPFTDFATIRPHVRINEGQRSIVWPTVGVWSASVPGGDVMLVLGPEPSLRWKLFCRQLVDLAVDSGARLAISMGALLADVPHSRPVQIIGTASDPDLIDRFDLQRSRYEGPTGIVGVLQHEAARAGLDGVSLWAAVPHYVAQPPNPKSTLALLSRLEDLTGLASPVEELREEADAWQRGVDELASEDEEIAEYVQQLEQARDTADLPEASGEAIAREFERYLRRRER